MALPFAAALCCGAVLLVASAAGASTVQHQVRTFLVPGSGSISNSDGITLDASEEGPILSSQLTTRVGCGCDVFSENFTEARGRSTQVADLVSGTFTVLDEVALAFARTAPAFGIDQETSVSANVAFRTAGTGTLTFEGTLKASLLTDDEAVMDEQFSVVADLFAGARYDDGSANVERSSLIPPISGRAPDPLNAITPFAVVLDIRDDATVTIRPDLSTFLDFEADRGAGGDGFLASSRVGLLTTLRFEAFRTTGTVEVMSDDPFLFAGVKQISAPAPIPMPATAVLFVPALLILMVLGWRRRVALS